MSASTARPPADERGRRFAFGWADLAFWVVALGFILLFLAPLYVLFKVSVSTLAEATAPRPSYLIRDVTWAN
jgi:ABC-type glycerol-3-phosphate transport system permease component